MKILEGKRRVIVDKCNSRGRSFEVENNAQLLYIVSVCGGEIDTRIEIELKGESAKSQVLGVFQGSGKDKFRITVNVHHAAVETQSEVLVKGVLKDSSQCFFSGLVRIDKAAQGSDASLTERTLLLSSDAKAESLPFLEIENNDVRVNHAVTVSAFDKEQLWYLQSRGLNKVAAEKLITQGFLEEVLQKIPGPVKCLDM